MILTDILCDTDTQIYPKESAKGNISSTRLSQLNLFSQWKLLIPDSTLPRGVKSMAPNPSDIEASTGTIDLNTDSWALEPKYCVNPNDLLATRSRIDESAVHSYSLNIKVQAQDKSYTVSKSHRSTSKQDCVVLKSEKNSVDLEDFQDITKWCQTDGGLMQENLIMTAPNSTDELNTPTFELNEFVFVQPTSHDNSELSYDLLETFSPNSDIDTSTAAVDIENTTFIMGEPQVSDGDNSAALYYNISNINEGHIYNNLNHISGGRLFEKTQKFNINGNVRYMSDDSTIDDAAVIFDVEPVQNYVDVISEDSIIIDDVNLQSTKNIHPVQKNLKLDFSNILIDNTISSIDTPEVIKTALSLDQERFNLCNYINNDVQIKKEDIADCSPIFDILNDDEDVASVQSSYSTIFDDISQCTSTPSSQVNSDESSDEEYVPPSKRTKRTKRKPRQTSISQEITEPVKRGRPVKIKSELSSPDTSRYRELRDKNNEASRKSRLNRKLKDQQMEDEANELAERNIKLKAEVKQLEKLVSSMRNNLMQILLRK